MLNKKRLTSIIAAILLVATVLGTLAPSASASIDKNDFSRPGSADVTVGAVDLLEAYLDNQVSEVERSFLIEYCDTSVSYSDGVTTAYVIALREGDRLEIRAHEYKYTAENGSTVVWLPVSATLLGDTLQLVPAADGSYVATFPDVSSANADTAVNVLYRLDIHVPTETVALIANFAYDSIPAIRDFLQKKDDEYTALAAAYNKSKEAYEGYLAASAEHSAASDAYKAWSTYKAAADAYSKYLLDMQQYEEKYQAHLDSEAAIKAYNDAVTEWNKYLKRVEEYEAALEAHESYNLAVIPYLAHLDIMAFAEQRMTDLGRSLYWAIHGTTVDSVLAEKDTLVNLGGVPAPVIDLAGNATVRLRVLLAEYAELETDSARYAYYKEAYNDLKTEFRNLFVALDFLYRNGTVKGMIKQMSDSTNDRNRKFQILLAQLYIMVNALWDEPVKSIEPEYLEGSVSGYKQYTYDSTFRIDRTYTVEEVLAGEEYISDTNSAAPLSDSFPTEAPHPGDPPTTELEDPGDVSPTYVPEPIVPAEVYPPEGDAPPEASAPGDPPTPVSDPGDPPTPYEPPAAVSALINSSDSIAHRDVPENADLVYTVERTVQKRFIDVETVTVDFYDTDKTTLLYTASVDRGTPIAYAGPYAPTRHDDDRAFYTFDGWCYETADGSFALADLGAVSSDMVLYPHFAETVKEYTVRWSVNGTVTEELLKYGAIPVYSGDTAKPDGATHFYTFSGWDKELVQVTRDVTYTATYTSIPLLPTSNGFGTVTVGDGKYTLDLLSTPDHSYYLSRVIERAAGICDLEIKTRYAAFTVGKDTLTALRELGAATLGLDIEYNGGRSLATVAWYGEDGTPLDVRLPIGLTLTVSADQADRLKISCLDGDSKIYVPYSRDGSHITFSASSSVTYTVGKEYRVMTVNTELADVTTDSSIHFAGDTVDVYISNGDTVRIKKIYYKTPDGAVRYVDGTSFIMPDADITVFADTEYITYKIVFTSAGSVLSTVRCKVGELPTLPAAPKKASDGTYSYQFVGWSSELLPATADATYDAVYNAVPLPPKADTGRGITVYMLFNLAAAGVAGFAFIAIPATVVNVVVMKKFRSKKLLFKKKKKD